MLPCEAFLHIKVLGLFGMISRMDNKHILHKISFFGLSNPSPHSWLTMVRSLFQKYDLGDPLTFLLSPPPKEFFKKKVKVSSQFLAYTPVTIGKKTT